MAVKWTDEEVALLREVASSHTVTELAAMFGRTATAIYQTKHKYGFEPKKAPKGPRPAGTDSDPLPERVVQPATNATGRPWTDEDDESLRREAVERTVPELAELFDRTIKFRSYAGLRGISAPSAVNLNWGPNSIRTCHLRADTRLNAKPVKARPAGTGGTRTVAVIVTATMSGELNGLRSGVRHGYTGSGSTRCCGCSMSRLSSGGD